MAELTSDVIMAKFTTDALVGDVITADITKDLVVGLVGLLILLA